MSSLEYFLKIISHGENSTCLYWSILLLAVSVKNDPNKNVTSLRSSILDLGIGCGCSTWSPLPPYLRGCSPRTHSSEGFVSFRDCLDVMQTRKISCPCRESNRRRRSRSLVSTVFCLCDCLIVFYYIGYVFYCFGYVLLYVYCIMYVLFCLRFIVLCCLRFIVLCLLFIVLCTYYFMLAFHCIVFTFYCIVLYYCIVLLYRFCLY
jgi:hypothetical protein